MSHVALKLLLFHMYPFGCHEWFSVISARKIGVGKSEFQKLECKFRKVEL